MSLKIKLRKDGILNSKIYSIIVIDSKKINKSRFICKLGYLYYYNKKENIIINNIFFLKYWIYNGAKPTYRLCKILKYNKLY